MSVDTLGLEHKNKKVCDEYILLGKFCFKYFELIIDGLVWFYGISIIVGHLILNPLYTYILNIYYLGGLGWVLWHINHCSFLIPNLVYTYISNINDLVGLGFMAYQPL